ncbi:MAG: PLP-dependent aminotransferase family protein [Veillonella sp.]|uniref:aminotransferase-like domain-containing protein n=1 Tax=Veillonella sp. TaxID=1926307 RepID=UPI0025E933CA|nr:PLP-dependent aminotransferase family protein [Veillonella sp.]MBS4912648.1 PLP-dependent aminotransferase family protein [Veillonella sp.]
MAIRFSEPVNAIKHSDTGDILKLIAQPDMISFAGGLPAEESFPAEQIRKATELVLQSDSGKALQYGPSLGYDPLRESIANRMNRMVKTNFTKDNILITCGSQQGLDMLCRLFCNKGDTVVVEKPSYLGAITAFNLSQVNYVEIPGDGKGMIMSELKKALDTHDVRLIYIVTDFQNPTGITWSRERREEFMALVDEYEVPVIEDNPYGELRYEGEYLPSLNSFDTKGLVCSLGTFSKTFAPGMRLGWIAANPLFIEKCDLLKQNMDLSTAPFTQRICAAWLENFDFDAHVQEIKNLYKSRRDAMLSAIDEFFPKEVQHTYPEGGLFIWCTLPEYMKSRHILQQCIEQKVAFVPGEAFFTSEGNTNFFRLNYSCNNEEVIRVGIRRIADVLKAILK